MTPEPFESLAYIITQQVWKTISAYNATKHWEESDIDDFYEELRAGVEKKLIERIGRLPE